MAVGRYRVIEGLGAVNVAAPQIMMTDADRIICALSDDAGPLVQWCADPRRVVTTEAGRTLSGRLRGSGKALYATSANAGRNDSNVLLGDRPAFVFTGGNADLRADNMLFPASFSFVSVAYYFNHKATPVQSRLMYLHDTAGATTRAVLTTLTAGNLAFGAGSATLETMAAIPYSALPADNTPFVVAGVYDAGAQKARIYLDGTTIKDESDGTVTIAPAVTDRLGIGGSAGAAGLYGWNGRIGKSYLFRTALSEAQVATVIAALRAEYDL